MASGRFAMALHALTVLYQHEEGVSSDYIASSVNTHAVFLRKVLRDLAKAGIVEAREGRGGGYHLSPSGRQITLGAVYRVIEHDGPLAPNPAKPNPHCPTSLAMPVAFAEISRRARETLLYALDAIPLSKVAESAIQIGRASQL